MIIQLNISDLPSQKAIKECVDRLKKDAEIIGKYPAGKKDGDPRSFLKIAAFLEILMQRTAKYEDFLPIIEIKEEIEPEPTKKVKRFRQ